MRDQGQQTKTTTPARETVSQPNELVETHPARSGRLGVLRRRFTDDEIRFIRDNYKTMTAEQIGVRLGRSKKSIEGKWKRLGLRLPDDLLSRRRSESARRNLSQTRCPEAERDAKVRAYGLINMRVRRGALKRPDTCSKCGRETRLDAHHDDYSKPDVVRWLCRSCHMKWHRGRGE